MIKCPKCGFEQPEDIFCANCGIDIGRYRGSGAGFKFPKRTFLLFLTAIGIAIIAIMFLKKFDSALNLDRFFPEGKINESNRSETFGTSSSLEGRVDTNEPPDAGANNMIPQPKALVGTPKAADTQIEPRVVSVAYSFSEVSSVEINQLLIQRDNPSEPENLIWGLADDIPLVHRSYVEREAKVKMGENKLGYNDEFIKTDLNVDMTAQDLQGFKANFSYFRNYENSLQVSDGDAQIKFEATVPYQKILYIIDKLPRVRTGLSQILATNSLLGMLHKSSTFAQDASECILILQFEKP
jgi:hypothetical protein